MSTMNHTDPGNSKIELKTFIVRHMKIINIGQKHKILAGKGHYLYNFQSPLSF